MKKKRRNRNSKTFLRSQRSNRRNDYGIQTSLNDGKMVADVNKLSSNNLVPSNQNKKSLFSYISFKVLGITFVSLALVSITIIKCDSPVNVTNVCGSKNTVENIVNSSIQNPPNGSPCFNTTKFSSLRECYEKKKITGWPNFESLTKLELDIVRRFCADYMCPQTDSLKITLNFSIEKSSGSSK